ncbi:hypothetical protein P175DRAFT_0529258 [Aspergillus ochraceoroseus IBT 24754]|uniref:Major facilitator superfamily (MFS) profile domain-containing protein n=1 Tax=Aspergillus ochraceoroseus IBT 24754 TaxID=1392256 RepID=A0A2T5MAX3_9EURO|nr:uncharacterized protein P175DRAFT_0529258 [Aspergillus ochraceoroseus IBT 24754]PTU25688.1 hypothetical protein P175DRAFT_0529258 [Aspergillus ochraceoroseus IBT 24754]
MKAHVLLQKKAPEDTAKVDISTYLQNLSQGDTICIRPPGGTYIPPTTTVGAANPTVFTTTATPGDPTVSGMIPNSWGIVATLTGIMQGYKSLVASLRIGYLFVSAALAGSIGGLFAYGIGHMDGLAGLRGWRWIIILEGIPTFMLGISIWFWIADTPDTSHYLTMQEHELINLRMRQQVGHTGSSDQMHKRDVYEGLKACKIWLFCISQFVGYSILVSTAPRGVKYFGCLLAAMGLYLIVGIPLGWLPSNNPRYGERTLATALRGRQLYTSLTLPMLILQKSIQYLDAFGHIADNSLFQRVGLSPNY